VSIRTALVGFGTAGRLFHAPFLAANPEFEISGVVTSRREQVSAEYRGADVWPSFDDVVKDAAQVDLAVIASPTPFHYEQAMAALEAGLHVVVDKPLAVTSKQGHRLIERARQLGRTLTVFQNRRWDGDFLTLRELVAAKRFGEVRRFESRFEWWTPRIEDSWKWSTAARDGGGILLDLAPHLVDQAVLLFGRAQLDYAEVAEHLRGTAPTDARVILRHESGPISELWMSAVEPVRGPRFRITGTEAGLESRGLDPQESQLAAGIRPGDERLGLVAADDVDAEMLVGSADELTTVRKQRGDYAAFYRLLADALLRDAAPPVDPQDSLSVLELIERIARERTYS
jgi:predicted dehydrogenase